MGINLFKLQMHIDCEKEFGITLIQSFIENPNYKYTCPFCRLNQNKKTKRKAEMKKTKLEVISLPPPKSNHLDELLKKFGGYNISFSLDEIKSDL